MLIVTMTTVGFGDFAPKSITARAFTTVIAVIGIFLMALCISLVHESLQLTQQEKRILAYTENTGESSFLYIYVIPIIPQLVNALPNLKRRTHTTL